ncbi:MAG: hypothetical protein KDA85_03335 [Planctomycetaceae bacterium]|nr:hypothetical protein [Planctomycetaceae bacterium]
MESSRSGLLSTLIMTVPLIVVPAIALLRPSLPTAGVSTQGLDASTDDADFLEELGELAQQGLSNPDGRMQNRTESAAAADFDDWFPEEEPAISAGRIGGPVGDPEQVMPRPPIADLPDADPFYPSPPVNPSLGSSVTDERGGAWGTPILSDPPGNGPDDGLGENKPPAERFVPPVARQPGDWEKEFRSRGVTRVRWFQTETPGMVGLATFIDDQDARITYRFEAVDVSQEAVMTAILQQIDRHQNR